MQYYYHADHLGSSSYITNLDAQIVQHVAYVPFGDVFIEERNQSWNTPYLFNGKELDEETWLYYYGARYYNPREFVWLSTDPLSGYNPIFEVEHYIDGQHNGGVFNSGNLNTYGYTYQNPIRYIDPNGKQNESYIWGEPDMAEIIVSGTISFIGDARAGVMNLASRAFGDGTRYRGDGGIGVTKLPEGSKTTIAGDLLDATVGIVTARYGASGAGGVLAQETKGGANEAKNIGKDLFKIETNVDPTVLTQGEIKRIGNAATRINKPITVVGSRASGTAGAYSDWDYVLPNINRKLFNKIKNSLPGSKSLLDNMPKNMDIFKGAVDESKPFIKIFPKTSF